MTPVVNKLLLATGTTRQYATWSPTNKSSNLTLSNGNLTYRGAAGNNLGTGISTIGKSAGKWIWQTICANNISVSLGGCVGACSWIPNSGSNVNCWINQQGAGYRINGQTYCIAKNITGTVTTQGTGCSTNLSNGTVVTCALDMDNKEFRMYLGGSTTPVSGAAVTGLTGTWYAACMNEGTATNVGGTTNFGATAWAAISAPVISMLASMGYNMGLYL